MPLGQEWYAIELARVREIVARPAVTPLPSSPPTVAGVFNLRGEIVPLFDAATVLGIPERAQTTFVTVVDLPLGPAGLSATGVPMWGQLGERLGESDLPATDGHYAAGARVVTLLDIDALVSGHAGG